MFISMCAWHPRFWGWPKLLGIEWSRPFYRVRISHGICRRCDAAVRKDAGLPLTTLREISNSGVMPCPAYSGLKGN